MATDEDGRRQGQTTQHLLGHDQQLRFYSKFNGLSLDGFKLGSDKNFKRYFWLLHKEWMIWDTGLDTGRREGMTQPASTHPGAQQRR